MGTGAMGMVFCFKTIRKELDFEVGHGVPVGKERRSQASPNGTGTDKCGGEAQEIRGG